MPARYYNVRTPLNGHRGKYGIAIVAALGIALIGGCTHPRACDDAWWGPDKQKHFAGSFLLGAGATLLAAEQTDPGPAAAIGFGIAATTGAAKETYDLNVKKTCWSWRDFAWDLLGASLGATLAAQAAE